MTQHILTYLGAVKPWPCEVCGKCIVRKNQLMLHKRKYTGENLGFVKNVGNVMLRKDT